MNAKFIVLAIALLAGPAQAENLLQIYREAQQNDPTLAAARATWQATQERLPQARSTLLPNVSVQGNGGLTPYEVHVTGFPEANVNRTYNASSLVVSATQPIYRYGNLVQYDQAREQIVQADFALASAQQDLIIRVAVAYFDILLAEYNIELAQAQKAAVSEQLAQAKRNFEVGVATVTDTNEAQAKYDQIVASEISTQNDYDNRVAAMRAIINRVPGTLAKLSRNFEPDPPEPNNPQYWNDAALRGNPSVQVAQSTLEIASLEINVQRAGHLPTLDLVVNYGEYWGNGSSNFNENFTQKSGQVGVQLNIPIYQGGFVNSKVREAIALEDNARAQLEAAKRTALFNSQTGFSGLNSAVASIKAQGQAVRSAELAYESNKLGQEVGIRTNLDVLNTQQNVYTARRDLASAYFSYLEGILRLKSSVGTLGEQDIEDLNRRLAS